MAFHYEKRNTAKAKKTPGKSYVAKGKKPKLGSGKRFSALESAIAKRGGVSNPEAAAAAIGRKKYGSKKMGQLSGAGRHRAAVKRKK